MKQVALMQRMEISFWNFFIRLLTHPRRWWLLLAILAYMLAIGSLGMVTFQVYSQLKGSQNLVFQPPQAVNNGSNEISALDSLGRQHNVLVVLVDQLDAAANLQAPARLEAIWLVVYLPSMSRLTALPVYPAWQPGRQDADARLVNTFGLVDPGILQPAFLDELHRRDLSWEGVVVIDPAGLAYLFEGLESVIFAQEPRTDEQLASWPPPDLLQAGTQARAALVAQAQFGQSLCQVSPAFLNTLDPFILVESLSASVATNIDPALVILEWNRLRKTGAGVTCEFPFLQDQEVVQ